VFSSLWCGMGGNHPTRDLALVANDPTEDLASMAKRFGETGKTVLETSRKLALNSKNMAKIPFGTGCNNSYCDGCASPRRGWNFAPICQGKKKLPQVWPVWRCPKCEQDLNRA